MLKQISFAETFRHLGKQLDKKLNFEAHLIKVKSRINKTIGIIRKLQNVLPRSALFTVYKSLIRSHLDYEDIIYDKTFNESSHTKLKWLQYNTTLVITGHKWVEWMRLFHQQCRFEVILKMYLKLYQIPVKWCLQHS